MNQSVGDVLPFPKWKLDNDAYVVGCMKPVLVGGIGYGAEWTETLRQDDWHPAEDLSVGDVKSFRVPVGAQPRSFFRLKVTNP